MLYKQIQKVLKISLVMFLGVSLFIGLFSTTVKVSAAVPQGCYRSDDKNTYISAQCNSPTQNLVNNNGDCYIAVTSQDSQTAYYKIGCTSISVGDTISDSKYISTGTPAPIPATDTGITPPDAKLNDCNEANLNRDNCGIVKYLVLFINVLSAMVGVVVAAVIIWGGIEYSTSGGDPSKVQSAKKRIYNGIFALVAFIFTYAFLQYIVPGGIL